MAGTVADLLSGQSAPAPSAPAGPTVAPLPAGFVMEDGAGAGSASAPPPPPPGFAIAPSGIKANLKAGAVEGITGGIGGTAEMANAVNPAGAGATAVQSTLEGLYDAASDAISGRPVNVLKSLDKRYEADTTPGTATHKLNQVVQAVTGYNPENTTAATFPERLVRGTAAGVTGGLLLPGGEGGTVANLLRNGVIGAGAGVGSTTAAEVAPENLKPLAGVLGGLAGGGSVGAAEGAAQAARAAEMPGVVRNVAAGVSPSAAETAAGRVLASRATDPAAAAVSLEQPGELVPGSQPTTFQQTGDMGLGSLEREVAAKNPAAFQQRRADQNAARVQALGDIQRGADPNDVANTLKAHFNDLDAAHEAAVNAATKAAQEKAAQFGGTLPPDQYGQVVRSAMEAGERSAASHVGSFYDAIDPNGDLTGNLQATRLGAQRIADEVGPTSMPMTPQEADIFQKATSLPDIAPANQLIELRKYLNAVARDPAVAGTPTSARLTQLRRVIDDNLANTISQQVANEAPLVERGLIEPSQSIAAKVQSEVDAWRAQRAATLAGGNGQAAAASGGGAATVHGVPGAEGGASEVAAGGTGSAAPVPGTAGFDEAGRQPLSASFSFDRGYHHIDAGATSIGYSVDPDGTVKVHSVKTPVEQRGRGYARAAMEQLLAETDRAGHRVILTPDPMDSATTKAGLQRFYKSLGFKPNTGKSRDLSITESFLREPRTPPTEAAPSGATPSEAPPPSANAAHPTFDEAARQRLAAANQAARSKAQTWGPASIEGVLAKDGNGNFRVSDGKVAAAYFHPGPAGFQHMQEALTAAPETLPALTDYAATTLRRAAMNEDGTLDPAKYERWAAAYSDARRALPADAQAKFADAASATQALADARASRTAALKQAQSGAIGRVMNLTEPQDVTRTVGTILNSRTAAADMKQLALATKGNAEARAGLRQAVADYMSNKLLGNTEAGTSGVSTIKADAYQTFIKNARPALNLIFTPDEVRTMEAVAEDIQRSNRSISAVKLPGGSNTTQDFLGAIKGKNIPGGHSLMNVLAAVAGEHQGGLLGAVALAGVTHLAQALHGAGAARIDELVTRAMLDPKLAAQLLKKAPPKPSAAYFRPISAALVKSVVPTSAATQQR